MKESCRGLGVGHVTDVPDHSGIWTLSETDGGGCLTYHRQRIPCVWILRVKGTSNRLRYHFK